MKQRWAVVVVALACLGFTQASQAQCPPRQFEWGAYGAGLGQFHDPQDIAVDETGSVYVADYGNNRIEKFTPSGGLVATWTSPSLPISGPMFIAADLHGHIYVTSVNTHQVLMLTTSGLLITAWGSFGTGPGQFSSPAGIAVDNQGYVYVPDGANRVQKFTTEGTFVTQWGSPGSGDGQLNNPRGIAVGSDGNIYIGDFGNQRVEKYGPDGAFLSSWSTGAIYNLDASADGYIYAPDANSAVVHVYTLDGNPACSLSGGFHLVSGVALNTAGDLFCLEWFDGPDFKQVVSKYSNSNVIPAPSFVLKWGSQGMGSGQLGPVHDLTTDHAGRVYVADFVNNRVQVFNSQGGYLNQWGSFGTGNSHFNGPWGIALDATENVFVTDQYNCRVEVFNREGGFITAWGSQGNGEGQFMSPAGIDVDASGNVFVADFGSSRIEEFDANGGFLRSWGLPEKPMGVTVDASGNVLVTLPELNRIEKFNSNGDLLLQWGSHGSGNGQFQTPTSLATDSNGHVFVADPGNNRVQMFDGQGNFMTAWGSAGSGNGQFNGVAGLAADLVGNVYVADLSNDNIQRFGPAGLDGGLRPVVLVHGFCSNGSAWQEFGQYLSDHGFNPHAISLDPKGGHPWAVVAELADYLDKNFAGRDVDIVAHSWGGLVARQLIRQRKDDCHIRTLVTVGTPHHGVDLYKLVYGSLADQATSAALAPILGCIVTGEGSIDLAPGSPFLNRLNYDTYDPIDPPLYSSRTRHPGEDPYTDRVTTWTFAGTSPFDNTVAAGATLRAWYNRQAGWSYYENDGVVGVNSAVLWNNPAHARLDVDMGLVPIQHFDPLIGLLYFSDRSFQKAPDLYPIIENVLRESSAPGATPAFMSESTAPLRAQSRTDSVETVVASESGPLPAGQVAERPFAVTTSPFLDVFMLAANAAFRLRKPDGTMLSPSDTLSVPGLTYAQDPTIGLGIYHVDDPGPGTWKAVFDASDAGSPQTYALGAHIQSTTQLVLSPATTQSYGGSVNLQASLTTGGLAQTGVAWTTTIVRPDSTSFQVDLYDDGAHGDAAAADGVYGTTIPLSQIGTYGIQARAVAGSGGSFFCSSIVQSATFKDLAIDTSLAFTRSSIVAGDSLIISSMIRNLGTAPSDSVIVELWDNHNKIESQVLPQLNVGASIPVSVVWHAAAPDTHLVELVVNPFVVPDEADINNNTAKQEIVLGHPIAGVGPDAVQRLFLGPAVPNPWTGKTLLRFNLPRGAQASLVIYDILGRRLKTWSWATIAAGQHDVVWDGRTDKGASIAPGVLFYRLETSGQIMKQKMIHL